MKYTIAITGGSGTMGVATVRNLLESDKSHKVKLLLMNTAKDRQYYLRLRIKYGNKVSAVFGNLTNYEDCKKLVLDSDYVIHMGAIIPPKSDHNGNLTYAVNYLGTVNVVNAVKDTEPERMKLIYISSVAVYGNRNSLHPWGRVGDPVLPSAFDVYANSKCNAEWYVLESGLKNWMILRQTGILYDKLLIKNISDGLMFHTCWNSPLEWISDNDSGILLKNIVEYDIDKKVDGVFRKIYNVGGGKYNRNTGYETFNDGFKMIGGDADSFFEPDWNIERNFHGLWFADGNVLNEKYDYIHDSISSFWSHAIQKHKLYKIAKFVPKNVIKALVIKRLFKNDNSPEYWKNNNDVAKIDAHYYRNGKHHTWQSYPLLCKSKAYLKLKNEDCSQKFALNHGYDETKSSFNLEDMKKIAEFRGGYCLSDTMDGDMYKPLEWQCAEGHKFTATPYTIVFGGHWCPVCNSYESATWRYNQLVPKVPFWAQVYYDSHDKNETAIYKLVGKKSIIE